MDMIGADMHQRFSPDVFIGTLDQTFKKINPRRLCSRQPQSTYDVYLGILGSEDVVKTRFVAKLPLTPP
jgi:hypothetical protein